MWDLRKCYFILIFKWNLMHFQCLYKNVVQSLFEKLGQLFYKYKDLESFPQCPFKNENFSNFWYHTPNFWQWHVLKLSWSLNNVKSRFYSDKTLENLANLACINYNIENFHLKLSFKLVETIHLSRRIDSQVEIDIYSSKIMECLFRTN